MKSFLEMLSFMNPIKSKIWKEPSTYYRYKKEKFSLKELNKSGEESFLGEIE